MNTPFKNVIFDIGNVLLTWQPEILVKKVFQDNYQFYLQNIFHDKAWLEFDKGTINLSALMQYFSKKVNQPLSQIELLMQTVKESLLPIDDSVALLNAINGSGIATYALTNMPAELYAYLRPKYSFWEQFKDIVVSSHIKLIKPDPAIFRYILTKNQLDPRDTLFLDDNYDNIQAAKKLGISAVQFTNTNECLLEIKNICLIK